MSNIVDCMAAAWGTWFLQGTRINDTFLVSSKQSPYSEISNLSVKILIRNIVSFIFYWANNNDSDLLRRHFETRNI